MERGCGCKDIMKVWFCMLYFILFFWLNCDCCGIYKLSEVFIKFILVEM